MSEDNSQVSIRHFLKWNRQLPQGEVEGLIIIVVMGTETNLESLLPSGVVVMVEDEGDILVRWTGTSTGHYGPLK